MKLKPPPSTAAKVNRIRLGLVLSVICFCFFVVIYHTSSSTIVDERPFRFTANEQHEQLQESTSTSAESNQVVERGELEVKSDQSFPKPNYQQKLPSTTDAANRAPFLPKLSIRTFKSNKQNIVVIKSEEVACWDRLGLPQKQIPSWVAPLLSQMLTNFARGGKAHVDARTFEDLFNATENEPNAALIGWIPTKFMGPQPPGVKANGQVMVPPTRGRDYRYYLKEYNASWHSVFGDNDIIGSEGGDDSFEGKKDSNQKQQQHHSYVFQLAHRNAIAVCIRERIHLHVRRCRPAVAGMKKDLPPILIHSCLCRKCEDKLVRGYFGGFSNEELNNEQRLLSPRILQQRRRGNELSVKIPGEFLFLPLSRFRQVPIQILLEKAVVGSSPSSNNNRRLPASPFPKKDAVDQAKQKLREKCLSVLAAPWLVSREVHPKFDYEDKETDLDALLRIQADFRGHVIVVIFNKAWVDHLYNWIFSIVNNAKFANFIVGTMDAESLAFCKELRLPCFDAVEYAVFEDDPSLQTAGHTRKVSEAMSWIKPRLASAILGRGYGFWMVDLDMTWNANPMKHILHATASPAKGGGGSELVHQCDSPARFSINSGFYDTKATLMTYLFFNDMMTFTPDENSDQTAMRLFGRYDHSFALYNDCLNKWAFDMKCNYKVPGSVKRVKGPRGLEETFEWNMMERDRSKFKWVIHHATCLSGAMAKILYLRTMNAWFLDDLEDWTSNVTNDISSNRTKDWCWWSPKNGIVTTTSTMGKIRFSSKYPANGTTDEKFLQRRH